MNKLINFEKIDIDAVKYNINYFKNKPNKNIIGVVKANGYGAIDYKMCEILRDSGVNFFAVSSIYEALNIRKHGFNEDILILGYVNDEDMNIIRDNNLSIITSSYDFINKANLKDIKIHIAIDTGMNRLGIKPGDAKEVYDLLIEKGAIVEGFMSHLYKSEEIGMEDTNEQFKLFSEAYKTLNTDLKYVHISATNGSLLLNDNITNYVRVGLGLLGFSDVDDNLKPAVSLYSLVTNCKLVYKGSGISYGHHYITSENEYILTTSIGYADGFDRLHTGHNVYVDKQFGTIVGSICMDQMMIKVDKPVEIGKYIELFGPHIDIVSRSNELNTIVYELLVDISDRVTRVYFKDGEIVDTVSPRF